MQAFDALRWCSRCTIVLLAGAVLGACATLPDLDKYRTQLDPKSTPSIVTAGVDANKSTPASRAKLVRRWLKGSDLRTVAALEEAATGVPLVAGNKVSLLFDGPQTMAEMLKAIAAAKNNINLETYIFDQDDLGQKFADLLIEKQHAGVTVNILYDSVGTINVPQAFFERMRAAGIRLVAFNPVNPGKLRGEAWKLNNRDHRKVLIVDGKVAFTGGVNISNSYAKSSLFRSKSKAPSAESDVGWRDTHIKVEGPAVATFQWNFVAAWAGQDTADLPEADYFPPLVAVGDKTVRVLASDPGGSFEIYKAYILAMQEAKKSIHLTSAYFVPDPQTLAVLVDAAKRGVDVKLILPGVSDSGLVINAGRRMYTPLLDAGVKIYELRQAVLHAKTAVIDGNWSTVGSSNIDTRSFLHNSELNVVILGEAFGRDMENAFAEDVRGSREITREAWARRPLADRLKEFSARFMDYWL